MKKKLFLIFSFYILFFTSVNLFAENKDSAKEEKKTKQETKTEKQEEKKKRKITINSAQYTEYKKVPARPYTQEELEKKTTEQKKAEQKQEPPKDDLIIFTGLVSISVSDGTSVSTIKADKIIHNKNRNTLTAFGNVFYERKVGSSSGESFAGKYLIFNIEKLEGVFLDGILEQAPTKKGRDPFRIHTNTAARNESGVIAFKNALLTTSKEDDPLWSIRASRLWILPGNEMAFVNGFLSVGVVPLIYLPFFYYPSDEMIVHPVFGYRNREGAFVQTTTYLYGRKPAPKSKDATSFSNFMQSDTLKKQELEGLFFKNLDEPASGVGSSHLKLIADAYSGLGYLVGLDGKFKLNKSHIKSINLHSYFGFSKTLYPSTDLKHSVYDNKGESHKNISNLFGVKVPFRYSLNYDMDVSKAPFNVKIKVPLVSDPFFKKDFMGRSEDMNWFKYLLDKEKLAKLSGPAEESRYSWKVDGSIRPNFPAIKPWVNSIAINNISSRFNFESKKNETLSGQEKEYSPERKFFYPKNFVPKVKFAMNGSIFSTSMLKKKSKKSSGIKLDGIKNPFEEKKSSNEKNNEKADSKNSQEKSDFIDDFIPIYKIKLPKTYDWSNFINYSLTYAFNGTGEEDLAFDYKPWHKPQDINWNKIYSNFYRMYGNFNLNSGLSLYKGVFKVNNGFDLKGNYQKHTVVKDPVEKKKFGLNNYQKDTYLLKNTNSLRLNPFLFSEMFKPTYFEWKITEDLVQNKFDGTYENPKWKTEKAKWEKEYIKTHSLTGGFGIVLYDYTQLITSSMNLDPLLESYSWAGNFSWPYTKFNCSVKIFEKEKAYKKWFWSPFVSSLDFALPYDIWIKQNYIYDIEDKEHDKYTSSVGWKSISASYNMSRKIPYKLHPINGWEAMGTEKKFLPESFVLSVSNSAFPFEHYSWKNRIALLFTFSSKLGFDLIKPTDSYFNFDTKFTVKVHELWDISFSSSSYNNSIARYFQGVMDLPVVLPGEKSVAKDLAYSFFFWDENTRRKSGFKLKSLNIAVKHYLKDWLMTLDCTLKPILRKDRMPNYYSLAPTISFVVQWNPIGDIKIHAKKEDKKFSVDRGEIK